jgi:biotin carboxyl carrier protein
MRYTVRGEKKHSIEFPRRAEASLVEIIHNGKNWQVEVLERHPNGNPSLVSVNGKILPIQVERRPDGFPSQVVLKGVRYPVEIEKIESTRFRPPTAAKTISGQMRADLPGVVAAILSPIGSRILKGQALIVVEAMKMENEICAPRDGIIKSIAVQAGQSVLKGDLLLELE